MRPYPEYKESGVEWLGRVPAGWGVTLIKRIADLQSGNSITSERIEEEGDYPVYGGNGLRGYTDKYTHDGYFPLIGRQGALCGNINYGNGRFWASEHAVVVRPHKSLDVFWLGELLRAMDLNQYSTSAAQPGLAVELIRELGIPVPPLAEQRAIAGFLDREVAKIDALIEESRALIAALAEKRQATISHAVTRGLNPSARLKPSGLDWLGDIPESWEVVRLRRLISGIGSGTSVNATDVPAGSDEVGILKTSCVYSGAFDPDENKTVVDEELDRVSGGLNLGTLIVSRMNTPDLVGAAGYVAHAPSNIFLPDRLWQVSFDDALADAEFIHFWTRTPFYRDQVKAVCAGTSSSMQNLSQDDFRSFRLALPPVAEQLAIVASLKEELPRLDALTEEANAAIVLLQERRAALISAAVTGKIDTRDTVAAA